MAGPTSKHDNNKPISNGLKVMAFEVEVSLLDELSDDLLCRKGRKVVKDGFMALLSWRSRET